MVVNSSLFPTEVDWEPTTSNGGIFTSAETSTITINEENMMVFFKWDTDTNKLTIDALPITDDDLVTGDDVWKPYLPFDAFDDPENLLDVTHHLTPIAYIKFADNVYSTTQYVKSNLAKSVVCYNGIALTSFIPL